MRSLRTFPIAFSFLLVFAALGFVLPAGSMLAQTVSDETAGCHPPRLRLNLGSLPLAFHTDSASSGDFEAVSLGGPRIEVGAGGATRLFQENHAIETEFVDQVESAPPEPGVPSGTVTTFAIGHDPANWRIAEPDLGSLLVAEVVPGVGLEVRGDNRRLVQVLTLAPGVDPASVAWSYAGASIEEARGPLGEIVVTSQAGSRLRNDWNVRVESPVAVSTNGEEVEAVLETEGNTVRLAVSNPDPEATLEVVVTTIYSDWIDDYEAVYANGRVWATGSAAAGSTGSGSTGGDAWVVGLDGEGRALESTLLLGGSGRDSGSGIAVASDGSLLVAGTTESEDLAGSATFGSRFSGGSDAFISRLGGDGLTLLSSTYHGGPGNETGEGVSVGNDGQVSIVGRADEAAEFSKPIAQLQTVFPTESTESANYFVVSFDESLEQAISGSPIVGPSIGDVSLWQACTGVLTVGIKPHLLGTATPCPTTEIIATTYSGPLNPTQNVWGDWAMRWVAGFQNRTYTPTCGTNVQTDVLPGDGAVLNACQGSNISPVPGSVWLDGTAATAGEQIVGTAMFIDYWNSVTFSRHGTVRMHSAVYVDVLAPQYNSFQDVCDSQGWLTTRGNVIDVVDADCANFANLFDVSPAVDICQVRQSYWSGGSFLENQFITGFQFKALFDGTLSMSPFNALPYVGDPPADQVHAVGYIDEFAQRMDAELGVVTEVAVTTYKSGREVDSETAPARVRLSDL